MVARLLLALLLPLTIKAEHRRFDGSISAASNYIHYSEGYVITPGYVDISDLEFEATSDAGTRLFPEGVVEADDAYRDDDQIYDDDGDHQTRRRRLEDSLSGTVSFVFDTCNMIFHWIRLSISYI